MLWFPLSGATALGLSAESTRVESYRTDSLDLAAYLVQCGFAVRTFDWETLRHGCLIVFEQTVEEVEERVADWNAGTAIVNASQYASVIRRVKRNLMESRPVEIRA